MTMILEGNVSVKAALLGGNRNVSCIYMDKRKHDKDANFIRRLAAKSNVPVKDVKREEIDAAASGRTHGGVIAEAEGRRYQKLEECFDCPHPFLVLLEGVEDPFNAGYVMRSLYSAGCDGLIMRPREWKDAESTILKSSAGASEYIRLVQMDPQEAVQACKAHGLYVYAAMRKDAVPYFDADFTRGMLLCIGGEMRGLSSGVLRYVDQNLYIPYANDFRNALNAAGASAALGFEVLRQRRGS